MADDEPLGKPKFLPAVPSRMEYDGESEQPMISLKKKKTRRGYGRKMENKGEKIMKNMEFSLMGSNANGIQAKKESLMGNINHFKPTVITIQETKLRRLGIFKLPGYQVFEKVRSGFGGGLMTAVDENLSPVLISTGKKENSEILVVQVKAEKHDVRIINAYGPQEDSYNKHEIYEFWQELEEEIVSAIENKCLLVIELDANAKLGKEHIKNDPNDTTENGKLLLDILGRHNLTVVNTMDICDGTITRERRTKTRIEKSVLDYIIVCSRMKEYARRMVIDEKRIHVLTKFASKKDLKKHKVSDHNVLFCMFSILLEEVPTSIRREFFQLKDKESQMKFLEETSNTNELLQVLIQNMNFHITQAFSIKI